MKDRAKFWLGVAVVALLVGTPTGAVARSLITGAQIKNHTIERRDLAYGLAKQGPRGFRGPKGDKGDKGDTVTVSGNTVVGPQGPAGKDGRDGKDGQDGKPGPQGPKGDPGATGAPGATGPAGPQGPSGINGFYYVVDDGTTATCAPGDAATGGGFTGYTGGGYISSAPYDGDGDGVAEGWSVYNSSAQLYDQVFAVCADR